MKNVFFAIFTLVVAALFTNNSAFLQAQTLTIGVVNVEKIVKEMPEAVSADKELTDLSNKYSDTIKTRKTDWETKVQNYQKQKTMMAATKQQEEETKLLKEQQDLQDYASAKNSEVQQLREKYLEPIRTKVKATIEAVAKEEKLSLVLAEEAALVIWSEPKLDITNRVIDKMKRGK
jgi:outer membrane protein